MLGIPSKRVKYYPFGGHGIGILRIPVFMNILHGSGVDKVEKRFVRYGLFLMPGVIQDHNFYNRD